jgi:hypothetical protein
MNQAGSSQYGCSQRDRLEIGIEPFTKCDMKQMLTTGKIALADLFSDIASGWKRAQ